MKQGMVEVHVYITAKQNSPTDQINVKFKWLPSRPAQHKYYNVLLADTRDAGTHDLQINMYSDTIADIDNADLQQAITTFTRHKINQDPELLQKVNGGRLYDLPE